VQCRQSDERILPFLDVRDFSRVYSRLNDEFVIDGKQLQDGRTRSDDASGGVLVELDDYSAHRRPHLSPLDHVLSGKDFLMEIIQLRLRSVQFLDSLLDGSRTKLDDLLLCASNARLGVTDASEQLSEFAG